MFSGSQQLDNLILATMRTLNAVIAELEAVYKVSLCPFLLTESVLTDLQRT